MEKVNLVYTDITNNNNKYWKTTPNSDGTFTATWGKVGDIKGQSKIYPEREFRSKLAEKLKKGYNKVDIVDSNTVTTPSGSLKSIAKNQIKASNPIVVKLIEKIADLNIHNITSNTSIKLQDGIFRTPLGVVSQKSVSEARNILHLIKPYVSNNTHEDAVTLTNSYLKIIPTNIGRNRLQVKDIFRDETYIDKQLDILESIEMALNNSTEEEVEQLFNMEIDLLQDSIEYKRIENYWLTSRQSRHTSYHYKLRNIYTINMNDISTAYNNCKIDNIQELWHGTKTANLLSIFKSGLRVPKSDQVQSGSIFGQGLYFANCATKSLNYSSGFWGGSSESTCYMFLCDVRLGKVYYPRHTGSVIPYLRDNDSAWAKTGNISTLINDEFIIDKTNQMNLKYLLEFTNN